jgi:DMSO/TMAO reductase YedYZ molybdopterin-dependent catalytic subunit
MKIMQFIVKSFVIICFVLTGCRRPNPDLEVKSSGNFILNGTESDLPDFNGGALSSISDFKEDTISGVQHLSEITYRLKIDGLVKNPLSMTYDQVLDRSHYSKISTLTCIDGWRVNIFWEGVLVEDLINKAGIRDSTISVIFHAADGYTIPLSLDYIRSHKVLLAHRMNGVKLPENRGFPFKVVAESKYGFTWVKWVTEIELSSNPTVY